MSVRQLLTGFAFLSALASAPALGQTNGTGTGSANASTNGQSAIGGATSVDQGSALEATINQNASQTRGGTQDGVQAVSTLNNAGGGFVGGSGGFIGGLGTGGQGNFNAGGRGGGGGGGRIQNTNQGQGQRRIVRPRIRIAFDFPTAVPRVKRSLTTQFSRLNARRDSRFEGIDFDINEKGLVTITGNVKDLETKQVAEAYIRLEPGVRKIKSEIKISASAGANAEAPAANQPAETPAANQPLATPSANSPQRPNQSTRRTTPDQSATVRTLRSRPSETTRIPAAVRPNPRTSINVTPLRQANELPQANIPPRIIRRPGFSPLPAPPQPPARAVPPKAPELPPAVPADPAN